MYRKKDSLVAFRAPPVSCVNRHTLLRPLPPLAHVPWEGWPARLHAAFYQLRQPLKPTPTPSLPIGRVLREDGLLAFMVSQSEPLSQLPRAPLLPSPLHPPSPRMQAVSCERTACSPSW